MCEAKRRDTVDNDRMLFLLNPTILECLGCEGLPCVCALVGVPEFMMSNMINRTATWTVGGTPSKNMRMTAYAENIMHRVSMLWLRQCMASLRRMPHGLKQIIGTYLLVGMSRFNWRHELTDITGDDYMTPYECLHKSNMPIYDAMEAHRRRVFLELMKLVDPEIKTHIVDPETLIPNDVMDSLFQPHEVMEPRSDIYLSGGEGGSSTWVASTVPQEGIHEPLPAYPTTPCSHVYLVFRDSFSRLAEPDCRAAIEAVTSIFNVPWDGDQMQLMRSPETARFRHPACRFRFPLRPVADSPEWVTLHGAVVHMSWLKDCVMCLNDYIVREGNPMHMWDRPTAKRWLYFGQPYPADSSLRLYDPYGTDDEEDN